jgi:hypothetical protein
MLDGNGGHMATCGISPGDKARLARALGGKLVKTYGKQRFYTVRQVKSVYSDTGLPLDWSCWGYALFTDHGEFDAYHRLLGEACDYAAMKAQMLTSMTADAGDGWLSFDMSWIDLPGFDLGSFIDFS